MPTLKRYCIVEKRCCLLKSILSTVLYHVNRKLLYIQARCKSIFLR